MHFLVAFVLLLFAACGGKVTPPAQDNVPAQAQYAAESSCAGCHAEIVKTYRQTGMGRAFAPARAELVPPGKYQHAASGESYEVRASEGKFFLRRKQSGPPGEMINSLEKEIHYVMGSGNHARTYLHRKPNGDLVELPLGWYAENGGTYAMSPGYDQRDHPGFRRAITSECMFCHNGYADAKTGKLAEGIGCQRCHGPAQAHVEAAAAGKEKETIRQAIFNPGKVAPARQLEVCLQCHLESTSRALPYAIRRFDRAPFSYTPQESLSEFIVHFDFPRGQGPQDHFEIAHQGYRMMQSRCFLASEGKMTCTSCHDPHAVKRGPNAFNASCNACHAQVAAHAGKAEAQGDCAACHMPKRRTDDVVHVVMTDHKVQARPARNLLAPLRETHEGTNAYRGPVVLSRASEGLAGPARDLYLATAQVYQGANLAEGVKALAAAIAQHQPREPEFYHQLAEAHYRLGNLSEAERWYRAALGRSDNYLPGKRNLGATLVELGKTEEAIQLLTPLSSDAIAQNNLGKANLEAGRFAEAAGALSRSLALDADSPTAWNNLGRAHMAQSKFAEAEKAWREAIRHRPAYAEAHNNLANLLHRANRWPEAQQHFQAALADAKYASARFNYGTALAERAEFRPAERYLREAIQLDPALVDAYLNLSNLLLTSNRSAQAVAPLESVLRLRPGHPKALLNLGIAYAESGRLPQARAYFQQAAQSSDAQIRQLGAQALRQMQ
ncbi:MAG: tetratricopeptide repeat protein [Bryobacter sp.]|nr:tetratricopeptide repeat protein [Bryobacter sp.]